MNHHAMVKIGDYTGILKSRGEKMAEIRKAEVNRGVKNVKAPSKTAEEVGPDKDKCNGLIFNPFLDGMKEEVKEMHST